MEKKEKLEIDIDIKDLFWNFLRNWRIILCGMLIGGVLLGARAYITDYQRANTPVTPAVKASTLEIVEKLSDDEWAAIVALDNLNTQLAEKSNYLENSILMKIDPFSENRGVLEYAVAGQDAAVAMHFYETWIENGVFSGEKENEYINELVTVTRNELTGLLNVQVLHSDLEKCKELMDEVKAAWNAYAEELVQKGILHESRLVAENQSVVVDEALYELQDAYVQSIFSDRETLAKKKTELTGEQVSILLLMVQGQLDAILEEEASAGTEVNQGEIIVPTEPVKVSISVKQILLGMILGAVVAVVYIFLTYLLTGKLRAAKEIELLYGTGLLGTVYEPEQKKKLFSAVDGLIWKLEHCREKKLTQKEEVELAAASISIQCKKYGYSSVYVSTSSRMEVSSEIIELLKAELAQKEIQLIDGDNVLYSADALIAAAETGSLVLLEKERSSVYKDILKCVQACATNHIQVLGMVVIEK